MRRSPPPGCRDGTTTTWKVLAHSERRHRRLYLDGIGYDREIMKRVRKVMDRARPGCLIDFH